MDVLNKVKHHMDEAWFIFIDSRVPSAREPLKIVKNMVNRLNLPGAKSLTVSAKEAEALTSVSLSLYAQGEKGTALL
jgi:hypothetical protein